MILLIIIPITWLIIRALLILHGVRYQQLRRHTDHYTWSNAPMSCYRCGSTSFRNTTKSIDGGVVSQYVLHCKDCDTEVGYWAYGAWDPGYANNKKEHPIWPIVCVMFLIRRKL